MHYNYAILGSGRQGTAAAYDLLLYGNCKSLWLVDQNSRQVESARKRLQKLTNNSSIQTRAIDIRDRQKLSEFLQEIDVCISAVPFYFNLEITKAAIATQTSMCDLGGNTAIVYQQLALHEEARKAEVSIVPDCGMSPGLANNLAAYLISKFDQPEEIYIWDGGLPQNPRPPWNYLLTFNFEGLINEYYGTTEFIRQGKIVEIPAFTEYELVPFEEPLGELEAFVTTGGTSTAPRTYLGRLQTYQNKTLRYPGHFHQWNVFKQAGFFETEPVKVNGNEYRPRDLLLAVVEPQIRARPGDKDFAIIRVKGLGKIKNQKTELFLEIIDRYDEDTGFTAMERLTGWHAAIVAGMIARGEVTTGAIPLEKAVSGERIVQEIRKRGIAVKEY
ncbi:MAG: hypothetical protein D6813_08275 [Calditrichaeota bacterium]|nr:MAG: hypothetical protein D6813_08275 [Calditrichota bacterium]